MIPITARDIGILLAISVRYQEIEKSNTKVLAVSSEVLQVF
jgi:hypothetical protein